MSKKSQNSRSQGFSYYFCLMMEGSGSLPMTNGSGSWRPPKKLMDPDPEHWFSLFFFVIFQPDMAGL